MYGTVGLAATAPAMAAASTWRRSGLTPLRSLSHLFTSVSQSAGSSGVPWLRIDYAHRGYTVISNDERCDARVRLSGHGASRLVRRHISRSASTWNSSEPASCGAGTDAAAKKDSTDPSSASAREAARQRLLPVLDQLPSNIDWAVAYGSGVIHQANAARGPPPMTDFLISTPSPLDFHTVNLRRNPSHYPLWARLAGASAVTRVQEAYGAGLWYVTMVKIRDLEVKYGVISSQALQRDLMEWDTLYVAGRLHKPVLSLASTPQLDEAIRANLDAALSLSLLLLPERFDEYQLWEQIAGISYLGDPRMSVPGAENPEKVKNIVRGPGNLQGFRELYADSIGANRFLRLVSPSKVESGDVEMYEQVDEKDRAAYLLSALPGVLRDRSNLSTTATSLPPFGREHVTAALVKQIQAIIYQPALRQSVKGLVTAGFTKSFWYSLAKFRKWLASRQKK